MKRSFVIGGIVAAAVVAGGGAATGVALAGSDAPARPTALRPPRRRAPGHGVGTAALKPGTALVDGAGRTLYLFEADNGTTLHVLRAVRPDLAAAARGPARPVGRRAGRAAGHDHPHGRQQQVTYNGHPLYYFANDKAAGDARGQGINRFGGGWYVVDPAGNKIDSDAPAPRPGRARRAGTSGY